MPPRAKWKRDGTSDAPKSIDLRLQPGNVRVQLTSGVLHKSAYDARVAAIKEAWSMGGIWKDAVLALAAKPPRFSVAEFYTARMAGEAGIRALMIRAGSEPLAPVIRDYLKQSRVSDTAKMRQRLTRFATSLGKAPLISDVTPARIEAFLSALTDGRTKDTPAKGSTINRYRSAIGGLCTWAVKVGRMPTHPIAGKQVEKRPEPHHRLPELSSDEYRDYVHTARRLRPDLAVVLLLLIHTGCDVGEVFRLAARDIDFTAKRVRFDRPKTARFGSLPRFVPMPAIVLEELRAHIAEHGCAGSAKVFAMVRRYEVEWLHQQCIKAITRPELTMKDLRHVAAIAWVKAGIHIRLVQRFLGHKTLSQTSKYTDYEPTAESMAALAELAADTLNQTADVRPLRRVQ